MSTATTPRPSTPDLPVDRNALKTTLLAPFIAVALVCLIISSPVLATSPSLNLLDDAATPNAARPATQSSAPGLPNHTA